jgi:chromosome segregation ATPase
MKEISHKINEAKSQLEKALSAEKAISASLAHSNEQQEGIIHDLQTELKHLDTQQASTQGKYEQTDKDRHNERQKAEQAHSKLIELTVKLETSENTMQQLKKQTTDHEQQLKQYNTKNHLFEKEAAVALQQVSNLKRQLEEQADYVQQQASTLTHVQKINNKLNSEIKQLEKAKAQAEQTAAIAEIKLEQNNT